MLRFVFTLIISLIAVLSIKAQTIKFDNTLHDFGKIPDGKNVSFRFKFINTGKAPLILSQPESSCDCTIPVVSKQPVLPGKSSEILVTFKPEDTGPFFRTITVKSNAANGKITLTIQGSVTEK